MWSIGVPKVSGWYWAWAADGDMMRVRVEAGIEGGRYTRVLNSADHCLGLIGPWPGLTDEQFAPIFSHFHPDQPERPAPPPAVVNNGVTVP